MFVIFGALLPLFAQAQIVHNIESGSLHSGGSLTLKILERRETEFDIEISYEIKPRLFVPVSREYRSGKMVTTLPIQYLDENGYLDLQREGSFAQQEASISYVSQEDFGEYYDSHHVRILPDNSKWKLDIWYHPSVAAPSWPRLSLELSNIPLIGRYTVYSSLRD